jgi:hypothetical protein
VTRGTGRWTTKRNGRPGTGAAAGLALLGLSLLAAEAAATPGPRQASAPGTGWTAASEWTISGNYVEACTDAPLCPGLFGAANPGVVCRKVLVFQVTRGRWRNVSLNGLNAVVVIDGAPGRPITPATRGEWTRCELWLPEESDSAHAEGLTAALGGMILGAGGPGFTEVVRMPLAVGIAERRVVAESVDRLSMHLRPAASTLGARPPTVEYLGHAFRFLTPLYVYDTDTLFVAPSGAEPTRAGARSGALANFSWSSEVAYREESAVKPG